ncbi:Uncharacterized protein conserved in bacteria [Kocuria rosea]|uniref:cupredoxin domain-containing protein n=1 Tax=Kocuria rosea TaxID=1275 RepID=UPI000F6C2528|nr:cupredoxin domain-containing protein [Kocuria rosea]VEH41160.1 Uncharacterized protein conserved in bacteria [Kocuria rosea]
MTVQDWVLVVAAVVVCLLLLWFFFGAKKTRRAELESGMQTVTVTVKGGYSPDLIQVAPGVPVRLVFDRQETGDCSSRVVFPDFQINQPLPAYARTAVEFTPTEPGEYGFACGMNMLHGRLRVVDEQDSASPPPISAAPDHAPGTATDGDAISTGPTRTAVAEMTHARIDHGAQTAQLTIRGGYHPQQLRVAAGVPLRLELLRQEDSTCSERFVVPDAGVDTAVPAFGSTVVEIPGLPAGRHEVTCGMNMLHGTLEALESPAGVEDSADGAGEHFHDHVVVQEDTQTPRPQRRGRDIHTATARWRSRRTPRRRNGRRKSPICAAG